MCTMISSIILFCPQVALGILKRSGYTDVVTAENGRIALDLIASRGGIDQFDLILMDLHMPVMVRRDSHNHFLPPCHVSIL